MTKVAECKYWAADYKNANILLDRASQKLSKAPDENLLETVEINRVRASIKMDLLDWKGAEVYLRKNIELLTNYGKDESLLRAAKSLLAHALEKQNRIAEANAVRNTNIKKRKNSKAKYDFLFTQEERAALQKEGRNPR